MAEPTNKITQDPAMECARSSSSIDANQEDTLLSSNDMGHTLSFKDIEPVYDKLVFVYKFFIQAERLERLANILDIRLKTELKRIYGCCYILVAATKTRDDQFLSLKKGLDILNITEEDIKNASQLTSLPRDNLIEVVNELYTQVMKHSETDTMLALAEAKRELKKASDSKTLIKCLSLQLDYARILRELTKDTIKSCAELNALTLKSLRLLSPGKRIDAPTSSLIQQAVALDVLQYSAMLNGEQAHHYLSQINRLFVLEDLDRQLVKQLLKAFITPRKPLINASEYYVTASRFMHSAKALQG